VRDVSSVSHPAWPACTLKGRRFGSDSSRATSQQSMAIGYSRPQPPLTPAGGPALADGADGRLAARGLPVRAGWFQTGAVRADQGGLANQGSRDEVVIRTPDQRLRVFVSSTLGELAEERRAVERAITALRLTPVLLEAGARPHPRGGCTGPTWPKATCSSGCTGSGMGSSALGWRSRGWRRSSSWRGVAAAAVCQGAGARPGAPPSCWPGSGRRPPIGGSGRLGSWAGWSATTWRCC
jgi:hypothetical protein